MGIQTEATPLLEDGILEDENSGLYTGDGSVDIKGNPVLKSETGNWRACPFILGNECCERLAYYGIATNLVTYLTTKLHEGNVSAARNVTTWAGTCSLTPLIGAVLADAYWGRYWTIATFSTIYFIKCHHLGRHLFPNSPNWSCASRCILGKILDNCYLLYDLLHNLLYPEDSTLLYETRDKSSAIEGSRKLLHTDELRCLDKAAVVSDAELKTGDYSNTWRLCTVTQVEELKILIRMFPIWATGIVFSAVYAQMSTMFVEQGSVMDTAIGSFKIPAVSLSTFDTISVIVWVTVYDRVIVPIARRFTGKERGFPELQRMGIGLFLSVLCISAAAIVEIKRLQLARDLDLVDEAVAVPLSIFWQIPQYFILGAAKIFTFIGQLEFFYDQSPDAMRSLCSALSLMTTSLGNYLSSFILTLVTSITTQGGKPGWIPNNLNSGHLDYFFWLLAALRFCNLVIYVFCAKMYKSKRAS
nr:protein NRT1/ PTR FAMILY 8.3-like [Nicotiana tomentosiformis]